jgi:hypothetical protein
VSAGFAGLELAGVRDVVGRVAAVAAAAAEAEVIGAFAGDVSARPALRLEVGAAQLLAWAGGGHF